MYRLRTTAVLGLAVLVAAGATGLAYSAHSGNSAKANVVVADCRVAKVALHSSVVFAAAGKVSGVWFAPAEVPVKDAAPSYVKKESFTEKDVDVSWDRWTAKGTLTMPKGKGPFPSVVLVQGSGNCDRDESVMALKPFRDIAGGLASRGIASVRYDKPEQLMYEIAKAKRGIYNVDDEVTRFALAAVALLRSTPALDTKRVFIVGNSLGGMIAPRIASSDSEIAGLVILAAAARPLGDVIADQAEALGKDPTVPAEEQKRLRLQLKRGADRLRGLKASPGIDRKQIICGSPVSYWLDMNAYDPVARARTIPQPILVLQGLKDYQVTATDYKRWTDLATERKGVECKAYPGLTHLFTPGQGVRGDYDDPEKHVDEQVITDMAEWIGKH
jgi:uncharacterized protein